METGDAKALLHAGNVLSPTISLDPESAETVDNPSQRMKLRLSVSSGAGGRRFALMALSPVKFWVGEERRRLTCSPESARMA